MTDQPPPYPFAELSTKPAWSDQTQTDHAQGCGQPQPQNRENGKSDKSDKSADGNPPAGDYPSDTAYPGPPAYGTPNTTVSPVSKLNNLTMSCMHTTYACSSISVTPAELGYIVTIFIIVI